jgi:hypothetical protein
MFEAQNSRALLSTTRRHHANLYSRRTSTLSVVPAASMTDTLAIPAPSGTQAACLKAEGGVLPLRWLVNCVPLGGSLPQAPETRRPDRFPNAAQTPRDTVLEVLRAGNIDDLTINRHPATLVAKWR